MDKFSIRVIILCLLILVIAVPGTFGQAAGFIANQVEVKTSYPVLWNKKTHTAPFLSYFPAGSIVKGCADMPLFMGQNDPKNNSYYGTIFLIELPAPIATIIVGNKAGYVDKSSGLIEDVYLNITGSLQSSAPISFSDPTFPYYLQYYLPAIAGGVKYTGYQHAAGYVYTNTSRIIVAALDCGANFAHQDFVHSWWVNTGEVAGNSADDDGDGYVDDVDGWDFVNADNDATDDNASNYHGMWVSSHIGARNNNSKNVVGLISDSMSVMVLKVGDASSAVTDFWTASAYNFALAHHARVANMSFAFAGTPISLMSAIATGIGSAYKCVPVAGVGNSGILQYYYPASGPHVLTVGADDNGGNRWSSSSYSDSLDIMAMGVSAVALDGTGTTASHVLSGTSMATPFISSVVWGILKVDSTLTVDQVISVVRSRGANHAFSSMIGWGYFCGWDTLYYNWLKPTDTVSFAACTNKHLLPPMHQERFHLYDSLRYGLAYITGDSIQTNGMAPGYYTYHIAFKFQPRTGVYYLDTFNLVVQITPGATITSTASITAIPGSNICSGTTVTFSCATSITGGTYQWYKNGIIIAGATAAIYITSALVTSDIITCTVTPPIGGCYTGAVTGSGITMTVTTTTTSTASVTASPGSSVCIGAAVTFSCTTSIVGGSYQWYKNGIAISGATSSGYSSSGLITGDVISCQVIPATGCYTGSVTSAGITMTVSPPATSTAAVTVSPASTICSGATANFTCTTSITGGSYQWYKNGIAIGGATMSTYSSSTLITSDVITCQVTPITGCYTGSVTSSGIVMTVNATATSTATIAVSPGSTVCSGTMMTFTVTTSITGGWYQWYKNGIAIAGATSGTYTISSLTTGDIITCTVTPSVGCYTGAVTSSGIAVTVNPVVAPTISITQTPPGSICAGTGVTFTSSITGGGSAPSYAWTVNGVGVGSSPTYSSTTFANGDVVTCTLTSTAPCAIPSLVVSNTVILTVNPSAPAPICTVSGIAILVSAGVYKGLYTAAIPVGITIYVLDWYLNGVYNNTSTTNTWVHNPMTNGHPDTVQVVLKPTAGCYAPDSSWSDDVYLHSPVSITAVPKTVSYNVYPNPVTSILYVEGANKGDHILVVNVLGQQISNHFSNGSPKEAIDFSSLVPGVYSVRIISGSSYFDRVFKILKE